MTAWIPWRRDLKNSDFIDNNDFTVGRVRRLMDDQLHWALALRTGDSLQRSVLEAELRRRESWPARMAIWISLCALAVAIAALFTSLPAKAEVVDGNRIVIIDGDTVALPCAVPARGCAEKIRFIDIDAPETFRPNCDRERQVGLQAKARVAPLLRGATVYIERSGRKDRYGRTLANLTTAEGDVGAALVREGLAVPYRPGKAAKAVRIAHWCGV